MATVTGGTGGPDAPMTPLVEIVFGEDLNGRAVRRLSRLLDDAIALRPAQLVVDLSDCGYANVLALEVLLDAHRRTFHIGGRLTLRGLSPRMHRLLQLSQTDQVFHLIPSHVAGVAHTRT